MARARSPEKRAAILLAAVHEIAHAGLGAPTSRIAARAGVAEGTLFTYFSTKEQLLNELYLDLKSDVFARINLGFPQQASLERRMRHIWESFLHWGIEAPDKRRAAVQLAYSAVLTPETRALALVRRGVVEATFIELASRASLRDLPPGFAIATMSALQETTLDFIAKQPRRQVALIDQAFGVFWRAVR